MDLKKIKTSISDRAGVPTLHSEQGYREGVMVEVPGELISKILLHLERVHNKELTTIVRQHPKPENMSYEEYYRSVMSTIGLTQTYLGFEAGTLFDLLFSIHEEQVEKGTTTEMSVLIEEQAKFIEEERLKAKEALKNSGKQVKKVSISDLGKKR